MRSVCINNSYLIMMYRRLSSACFMVLHLTNTLQFSYLLYYFMTLMIAVVDLTLKRIVLCIFSIAEYYTLPLGSCVSLIMLLNPLCLTTFTCKTKRLNDRTILKSLPVERWQDYQIQGNFCNQLYIPESSEVETLWLSFFPKCGINITWECVR